MTRIELGVRIVQARNVREFTTDDNAHLSRGTVGQYRRDFAANSPIATIHLYSSLHPIELVLGATFLL